MRASGRRANARRASARRGSARPQACRRSTTIGAYGALASPPGSTVTDIDVPFFRLMTFFIKAVFAAVPALIMLTALLWLFGQGLQSFFPQLLKMKIDVQIYAPQSAADFRPAGKERR